MKRFVFYALIIIGVFSFLPSCQKAPFLTITGARSFSFTQEGGSQTFSFSCNRDWSVTSSDYWIHISPSSGTASEEEIKLTITCSSNANYDPRTGSVTIKVEDLIETLSITQETNIGLIATPVSFNLSNEEQTISVNVQSNVPYSIEISDDAKEWISLASTKALSGSVFNLSISKNDGYERTGKITLTGENLQSEITILQKSRNVMFEDGIFKQYCIDEYDKDKDGEISLSEALSITHLEFSSKELSSFSGIEDFINLEWLEGTYQNLFNFDARCVPSIKTLRLYKTQITSLDVRNCKTLQDLHCEDGVLTNLIVNGCEKLEWISCVRNRLTSLDVSECVSLQILHCVSNQLTSLNISGCKVLRRLECGDNQLTSIDVGKCPALNYLFISNNKLSNLDISACTALEGLSCGRNLLTSIDVSKCPNLQGIACNFNQLKSLDVSRCKSLQTLYCAQNQLSNLNIVGCTKLRILECNGNQIIRLDISGCIELESLECQWNQIAILDIRSSVLNKLDCEKNLLSNLDVSGCPDLRYLFCSQNKLTSLNVSNCTRLGEFECGGNMLVSLDVSYCPELYRLYCGENPHLKEIWLRTGQIIRYFYYENTVSTLIYKN